MRIKQMAADLGGEKITIIRKNGDRYDNVTAIIDEKSAHFDADEGLVDIGDEIHRNVPTGTVVYIVEDPGYFAKSGGFHEHFQAKIRRSTKPPATQPVTIENVHMSDNARLNLNSTDNSTNVVQRDNVYNQLRDELTTKIDDTDVKEKALAFVDEMEAARDEADFNKSMGKMMTLGVKVAEIFGPFIPLLTPLIGG